MQRACAGSPVAAGGFHGGLAPVLLEVCKFHHIRHSVGAEERRLSTFGTMDPFADVLMPEQMSQPTSVELEDKMVAECSAAEQAVEAFELFRNSMDGVQQKIIDEAAQFSSMAKAHPVGTSEPPDKKLKVSYRRRPKHQIWNQYFGNAAIMFGILYRIYCEIIYIGSVTWVGKLGQP